MTDPTKRKVITLVVCEGQKPQKGDHWVITKYGEIMQYADGVKDPKYWGNSRIFSSEREIEQPEAPEGYEYTGRLMQANDVETGWFIRADAKDRFASKKEDRYLPGYFVWELRKLDPAPIPDPPKPKLPKGWIELTRVHGNDTVSLLPVSMSTTSDGRMTVNGFGVTQTREQILALIEAAQKGGAE